MLILKKMIEDNMNVDDNFIGLGSKEEEKGFSENKGFYWYEKRYEDVRLSLYDELALLNMISPQYEAQKEWYNALL